MILQLNLISLSKEKEKEIIFEVKQFNFNNLLFLIGLIQIEFLLLMVIFLT
jgi:hypothetical protein